MCEKNSEKYIHKLFITSNLVCYFIYPSSMEHGDRRGGGGGEQEHTLPPPKNN